MPQAARRRSGQATVQPPPRSMVHAAASEAIAHASPARSLQAELQARITAPDADATARWPGAVRVLIIVGGSLVGWASLFAMTKIAIELVQT